MYRPVQEGTSDAGAFVRRACKTPCATGTCASAPDRASMRCPRDATRPHGLAPTPTVMHHAMPRRLTSLLSHAATLAVAVVLEHGRPAGARATR